MNESIFGSYKLTGPPTGGTKTLTLKIYKDQLVFTACRIQVAPKSSYYDAILNNPDLFTGELSYDDKSSLLNAKSANIANYEIELLDKDKKIVGKITDISDSLSNDFLKDNVSWRNCNYLIKEDMAVTTEVQTIVPIASEISNDKTVLLADKSTWKKSMLGFNVKPGLSHELREDIVPDIKPINSEKILNFFTISDIHITDKESPSQLIYLQQIPDKFHKQNTSVYSPVMPYTTHVLDAAVQTINALHKQKVIMFDLGISLGDTCNNTQLNETQWYVDVMKGGLIRPSSGSHSGENTIKYQKPFFAQGLNKEIKWYQVVGNHDLFCMGSVPIYKGPRKDLQSTFISDSIIRMGDVLSCTPNDLRIPLNLDTYSMGVIDGNTEEGKIICQGSNPTNHKIASDLNRQSLSAIEWMNQFKDHGFPNIHPENHSTGNERETLGCYSFNPETAPHVKIICLDDVQREDDGNPGIHGHGYLDAQRWKWFQKELEDGQSDNKLMIITAHIPIGVEKPQKEDLDISPLGWADFLATKNSKPYSEVPTEQQLLAKLYATPNVLMWIAGHRHYNTVSLFKSPDGDMGKGFWQVETSSLRDFPQQFRTFEISIFDDVVSVKTTNVDYASPIDPASPTTEARYYAVAAQQIVKNENIYQNERTDLQKERSIKPMSFTGSYNAILLKKVNKELATKLQSK